MKRIFIYQILGFLMFTACKKEKPPPSNDFDSNPIVTAKATDYYPLEVGNYWIYESFQVDSLGNDIQSLGIDSVVVGYDSIIDGQRNFYIGTVRYPDSVVKWYSQYRDSSGYIVNQYGQVFLSVNNFTDILHTQLTLNGSDTIEYIAYKMEKHNGQVKVPAGSFSDLLNFKGQFYSSVYYWNNGRSYNRYYQKGVGEVFYAYFHGSQYSNRVIERRLIRYHIKEE